MLSSKLQSLISRWKRSQFLGKYSTAIALAEGGGDMVRNYLNSMDEDKERIENLRLEFKSRYHSFKTLLQANNSALENMGVIQKKIQDCEPIPFSFIKEKAISVSVDVYRMIRSLEEIVPQKYPRLHDVFQETQNQIKIDLDTGRLVHDRRLTLPLEAADLKLADIVGNKMAKLGEIHKYLEVSIPAGFVITTNAHELLVRENRLNIEISRQLQMVDFDDIAAVQATSLIIQDLILKATVPPELEEEILDALSTLKEGSKASRFALRSSAMGEDTFKISSAGQYLSKLNVSAENVLKAYKAVIASKYSTEAIIYRFNHGLIDEQILVAVGCLEMLDPIVGGVIYTRDPVDFHEDGLYINSCWGLPKSVVEGDTACDSYLVSRFAPYKPLQQEIKDKSATYALKEGEGVHKTNVPTDKRLTPSLTPEDIAQLAEVSVKLERYFGKPQDIEWCLDHHQKIRILQCRPLKSAVKKIGALSGKSTIHQSKTILIRGGTTVSNGVTSGEVFRVEKRSDFANFPKGAILITSKALPRWAPLLSRAAGIIAEEGSYAGHLANVAREFNIPALFSVPIHKRKLKNGTLVTLDADHREIHLGKITTLLKEENTKNCLISDSPVYQLLKKISKTIVPLTLTDPDSADFRASKCKTLHDITRFVHEKSVAEMFDFGKTHHFSERSGKQLFYKVPMQWWILNLDDGFKSETNSRYVRLENIVCAPMIALWQGIIAIPWEGPPPIDGKGFMSVMFQATTNSSLTTSAKGKFADKNYFMISKNFCNLSSRLGFHFTTVEAIACEENPDENYIRFQYKGGAADYKRRLSRVEFLGDILENYGFYIKIQKDTLIARMESRDTDYIKMRLTILGYLMIHTRQIDMIMANRGAVSYYKAKFERDIQTILENDQFLPAS